MQSLLGPLTSPLPFRSQLRLALLSLIFLSPVIISFACLAVESYKRGEVFTGFYTFDSPYYLANGRNHFDTGDFTLLYKNPYDPAPDSPRIYFQPHLFVLGGLIYAFQSIDPGHIALVFNGIFAFLAIRAAILLYSETYGLNRRSDYAFVACLLWGGGAVFILSNLLKVYGASEDQIDALDPVQGFWALTFGRNLWLQMEPYYHFCALTIIRLLIKQRFLPALGIIVLMASSSPMAGLAIIVFACFWAGAERWFFRSTLVPRWFVFGCFSVLLLDIVYYLVWLPSYQSHAILQKQWTLDWLLQADAILANYSLIGLCTLITFRRSSKLTLFCTKPYLRIFLALFIVIFALANHEAFFTAHQPIHFARGYIWIALFFMAVPGLRLIVGYIRRSSGRTMGTVACSIITMLFLLDNGAWLLQRSRVSGAYSTLSLEKGDYQALRQLREFVSPESVVITNRPWFDLLVPVYTDAKVYCGHIYNTPHGKTRSIQAFNLIQNGDMIPGLDRSRIIAGVSLADRGRFVQNFTAKNPGATPKLAFETATSAFYTLE